VAVDKVGRSSFLRFDEEEVAARRKEGIEVDYTDSNSFEGRKGKMKKRSKV